MSRLEDTDSIKNAFEVSGPLIEKIVAVCQGPKEANKWVDLISAHPGAVRQQTGDDMKRNTTTAVNIVQPPAQVRLLKSLQSLVSQWKHNNNVVTGEIRELYWQLTTLTISVHSNK